MCTDIGDFKICGLIGAAGPLTIKHERAIRTLLILDAVRGIDSTGIATIARNRDLKMAKSVGDPFRLFDTKSFDKAIGGINSVIIGHNRFATQGKVNSSNAHPFAFEKLVGAHNGTLKNKYALDDAALFEVDSENLYHHMNKNGVENTIHKLDGAWALTWYNHDEDTINLIRNSERPLFTTLTKENVLFWASESWMLRVALSREGLEHTEVEMLGEDTWYKIEVGHNGALSKPHLVPLASKVIPYVPKQNDVWDKLLKDNERQRRIESTRNNSQTVIPASNMLPANPYKTDDKLTLEVIGEGTDKQGARYYMCKDRKHTDQNIRLYKAKADKAELMGKFITCKLHAFRFTDYFGNYHKVEHSSVALVIDSVIDNERIAIEGSFYHDSKQKLIPYKEWMKKHGTCDMCSAPTNPEQDNRFTANGDIICHVCAVDPVTQQYCQFQ